MTKLTNGGYGHIPVLYRELIDNAAINPEKKNIVIDCTIGLAGHAIGIIDKLKDGDVFVGFDCDEENLISSSERISEYLKGSNKNITTLFIHSNFSEIKEELTKAGIDNPTLIYYDFGVNSVHYDIASKGFSFRFDGPLDLRFDRSKGKTAAEVVNTYDEAKLKEIMWKFGEEKKTPFIVKAIMEQRESKKINTTFELAELIRKASFDPKSKTRVFQALRIEVNKEFDTIEKSLNDGITLLAKGGVMSCITFHSLEDRLVKDIFASFSKITTNDLTGMIIDYGIAKKITRKPLIPSDEEISSNPRSRSAKLRVIEKL